MAQNKSDKDIFFFCEALNEDLKTPFLTSNIPNLLLYKSLDIECFHIFFELTYLTTKNRECKFNIKPDFDACTVKKMHNNATFGISVKN